LSGRIDFCYVSIFMARLLPKNPLLLMAAALLLPCGWGPARGTDEKILPYPIHQKQLANGLNVVTVSYPSPGLAAFYIVVRAGARDEIEPGKTGFAHFFEHMMFRGTEKYPKEKYSYVLKGTGASANANTSADRTVYHMTGNAGKLETMFDVEADRFQNLKYSLQDFKTEAGAVKGEYIKNSASPYRQLEEKIAETAFKTHTYAHTTMGYFKDIVAMPDQYDYSLEFFRRFYRPEHTTIIVVGSVTPGKVDALAARYFGAWPRGQYASRIPPEPAQSEARYTHVPQAGFPPFLSLNYKGPAFSDTDMDVPTLDVLSAILFSEKSDLYKKLVLQEQRVRSLGGGCSDARDPGLITISASLVRAEDLQVVKDEIVKALEAAKTNPVDARVLAETKAHLRYSFLMGLDNPTDIAESLSHYNWLTGDPEALNRLYALYEKVTPADVLRVAKKYFVTTALTVGTISSADSVGVQ
ncbi:MAG: pitrilysin family protein, partial [Kiritimatiellaeota bacterium]|nr:pitrilysin family protein [Kiritimatiellota bacterium]